MVDEPIELLIAASTMRPSKTPPALLVSFTADNWASSAAVNALSIRMSNSNRSSTISG